MPTTEVSMSESSGDESQMASVGRQKAARSRSAGSSVRWAGGDGDGSSMGGAVAGTGTGSSMPGGSMPVLGSMGSIPLSAGHTSNSKDPGSNPWVVSKPDARPSSADWMPERQSSAIGETSSSSAALDRKSAVDSVVSVGGLACGCSSLSSRAAGATRMAVAGTARAMCGRVAGARVTRGACCTSPVAAIAKVKVSMIDRTLSCSSAALSTSCS